MTLAIQALRHFSLVLILATCVLVANPGLTCAQTRVVLEKQDGQFQLIRNGKPYVVKGVGGTDQLDLLAAMGGNSIRTWSTDDLDQLLDEAHQRGLSVCVGLWVGHERHGFNYQDEAAVTAQLETLLEAVRKYKSHPAVLLWGIGNEMEGEGTNPAVWYAVNHLAREIKRIDPDHPTMTVIAELGDHKLKSLEQFCPDIDLVGVNSYGGLATLPERYRKSGCSKPYLVTEFGPLGPWEVEKTRWGAPLEETSSQKAQRYSSGYQNALEKSAGQCLGGYAFLWGWKQETTATWFGMILPDGQRLAAADAMQHAWTRKWPANRCPEISQLKVQQSDGLKPGQQIPLSLTVRDPESDSLSIVWKLRFDSTTIGTGGDFQKEEDAVANAIVPDPSNPEQAIMTVPEGGGAYRVFAYVSDSHGGAAVANQPIFVDAPIMPRPAAQVKLPFDVYSDEIKSTPYAPSGYMGNTQAIVQDLKCREQPHSGETCLQVDYKTADNWGGVLWQSPPNDWEGKFPGGFDLTGATRLEFWARGDQGGEVVSFVLGVIEGNSLYRDSSKSELSQVPLKTEWQRYEISLTGKDLQRIKTGFGWSIAGQGKPVRFYLDDIRYVSESNQ
ncbi:MAG: hypothetical protein KDA78_08035 [Planctomycetaceae bacterium]|nr:hypothetical protein [Planctomycetaceae bacterium]